MSKNHSVKYKIESLKHQDSLEKLADRIDRLVNILYKVFMI